MRGFDPLFGKIELNLGSLYDDDDKNSNGLLQKIKAINKNYS